tara:strand:+ start:540 stop:1139 length:600 start_codon:yes stop_codon:yes gene_type:complete
MAQAKIKSVYETLSSLSIKGKVERKGKLDYLSWANAWHMLKQKYPNAQRKVYEHEHTGFNYFTDGRSAWVKVGIVVGDIEHIDMLPVMDFRNNSISVDKITSMDVNKAIQRSTAKAIAMHGLGLSLWTGEDVPELTAPVKEVAPKLIALKVGDANWKKVEGYIVDNKTKPLADIVKKLGSKYTQGSLKVAEKAIKKLLA